MPSTRPFMTTVAASIALFGLAACSSNSTPTASTEPRTGLAPDETERTSEGLITRAGDLQINHDRWRDAGYRWEWSTHPRIAPGSTLARVNTGGDLLLAQDSRGTLSAVETATGRVRWSVQPADSLIRFLGAERVNNTVLVFSRPSMYVLDADTGNFLTRQDMDVVVGTHPVIDGGLAVFGTPTGEIYAHEFGNARGEIMAPPLNRGARAWGYDIDGAINTQPAMVNGRVGVVSDTGTVFFVDPISASGVGRGRIYGGVDADPVTDGQRLYMASRDQSVYAFNSSGDLVWRYPTASVLRTQPTIWTPGGNADRSVLYVAIPGEGLVAFDGPTGERLWASPDAGGTVMSIRNGDPLAIEGNTIFLLDQRDGSVIERFEVRGLERVVADGLTDATLYAVATDGYIAKLTPRQ